MEYNKSMYLKIIKNKFFCTLTCTRSYFTDMHGLIRSTCRHTIHP